MVLKAFGALMEQNEIMDGSRIWYECEEIARAAGAIVLISENGFSFDAARQLGKSPFLARMRITP